MKLSPFFLISICLFMLAISPGSAIQIEDDDASLDISLIDVHVPTQTVAVTRIIVAHEDAITHSDLRTTVIPTERLPIRKIYTSNEDAAFVVAQLVYPWELISPDKPVNQSPQFQVLANQQIEAGGTLSFQLGATDPDADLLTFSAITLPSGAELSNELFTWTPDETQLGTHQVTFTVADGRGGSDTQSVSITVASAPEPADAERGDVNADGKVDFIDAIQILKFSVDIISLTPTQQQAGDVDRSGTIDFRDATLVLQLSTNAIDQSDLREKFPKPLLLAGTHTPLSLHLTHVESGQEQRWVHLESDPIEGIAGGEFLLSWENGSDIPVDVSLEGCAPSALCVVNDRLPGQHHLTFLDLARVTDRQPVHLRIGLPEKFESPVPLNIEGRLYDREGVPLREMHFDLSVDGRLPTTTRLHANFPNPFNPSTVIPFELSQAGSVVLQVFTLTGQRVRTLVDGRLAVGVHAVEWDGRDDQGQVVASGVYLYRLSTRDGRFTDSRRMILIK